MEDKTVTAPSTTDVFEALAGIVEKTLGDNPHMYVPIRKGRITVGELLQEANAKVAMLRAEDEEISMIFEENARRFAPFELVLNMGDAKAPGVSSP